jgi:hypothetical protein
MIVSIVEREIGLNNALTLNVDASNALTLSGLCGGRINISARMHY